MSDLTDSTLFKALEGLRPVYGGVGRYPGVGQWTRHLDPDRLQPCVYGYHLTRGPQVLGWLGPTLYEAEACPDHPPVNDSDKLVTCRVRLVRHLEWDDVTARLFAADCAEAALLGERASGREPDERLWAAVVAVRRFARGEIDRVEFNAARDAAWAAAWETPPPPRATARSAAAAIAAWGAVRAAAAADAAVRAVAAEAAAEAAADAAAIAVRAAAAADAAVRAAAVRAAAEAAADAAVRAAAQDAKDAQYRRLCAYLEGAPIPPVEPLYGKETPVSEPVAAARAGKEKEK